LILLTAQLNYQFLNLNMEFKITKSTNLVKNYLWCYLNILQQVIFPRNGVVNKLENEKRPITFIGENLSDMVVGMIKDKYPKSELIII
jgi:hypothetical protein